MYSHVLFYHDLAKYNTTRNSAKESEGSEGSIGKRI
jgi:hypothetical protein